jgi:hypothetical protein
MSSAPSTDDARLPTTEAGLTADELFRALAERASRHVLRTLGRRGGRADLETLATTTATDDPGGEGSDLGVAKLHHVVLPGLERSALVSHDDGEVVLTDGGWSVVTWLETVTPR